MDLATCFEWTAERYPFRRAVGGADPMTYRQWSSHARRLARALAELGVQPGDRVALLLAGGEPLASLHMACQVLGAVSVPLSTRFGAEEIAYCVSDSAPRLAVGDSTTYDRLVPAAGAAAPPVPVAYSGPPGEAPLGSTRLDEIAQRQADGVPPTKPAADALSVMLYTSGTTGRPKGVPRSHRAEHAAAIAHLIQTGHAPGEVTLGVMPLFHTMGIRSLLASVAVGGTWVPQASFDADLSLELIDREQVSALYLVPTVYWALLQTARLGEMSSVRRLAYAGAAMAPTLAEQLTGTLRPERFVNHFGSTEIYTFTIGPDVRAKPGCAGRAGVFSRVRLVDPEPESAPAAVVRPGEQGQVAVSMQSPEAFAGYWHRRDADTRSIRDGWYFTGDLATADDDGDLWVSGRVDDMINSGGENLYPEEIENALARCGSVDEVIVAGLPDVKWGHAATAFVVPQPGMDPVRALSDVDEYVHARSGLPSMKRPKRVVVVDAIPKSAVGKVLRRELVAGRYAALAQTRVPEGDTAPPARGNG
ncbi:MAG: class I adenylate-forming enzyme family protein [Nocardioidaceae bacterium]